jgi:GNAT superfamily N-acetyltransferase
MGASPIERFPMEVGSAPRLDGAPPGAPGAAEPDAGRSSPGIRVATPADNAALLDLTRACPMRAHISLCMERDPDFFALMRARGEGRTLVAEQEGRVVACGSVCRWPAYVLGVPGEMGYVGDLKVAPHYRRTGLARRIIDEIARGELGREPAAYVGTAAAGNAATEAMLQRFGAGSAVHRIGTFTSYQLLPLRRLGIASHLDVGRAQPDDEEELVAFLDAYHRRLSFAPVFRDGGLRRLLGRSPGMALDSYRVARRQGRIVAAVAVWDGAGLKHTRVHGMTRRLRWTSRLIRSLGTVLPLPPFPAEGELLRFVYLRHPAFAYGALDALAALVRAVLDEPASRRLHFALFTCADGDPIARCLRGIPRTTYHYGLVAGTNAAAYDRRVHELRGAPLYDDAALS